MVGPGCDEYRLVAVFIKAFQGDITSQLRIQPDFHAAS